MKSSEDRQLNKMKENVQAHFKEFHQILKNFELKTGAESEL